MFAHTYHRFCCGRCAYTNLVCLMLAVAVQLLSRVRLFATPWTAAHQASLSFTISSTLLRLMSIELVMPSISFSALPSSSCPQSFPASGSFPMSWLLHQVAKVLKLQLQHLSFRCIFRSPSDAYSGLISFRIDWFDLFAVQETLRSLLQHHNSKTYISCLQ